MTTPLPLPTPTLSVGIVPAVPALSTLPIGGPSRSRPVGSVLGRSLSRSTHLLGRVIETPRDAATSAISISPSLYPVVAARAVAVTQGPRPRRGRSDTDASAARGSWVPSGATGSGDGVLPIAAVTIPTLAADVPLRIKTDWRGWSMARRPALTADTITAISEGFRVVNMVFLRDGRIDEHERVALAAIELAAGRAAWADWARRRHHSVEDGGATNVTLERERRELVSRWGEPEPLEAA